VILALKAPVPFLNTCKHFLIQFVLPGAKFFKLKAMQLALFFSYFIAVVCSYGYNSYFCIPLKSKGFRERDLSREVI